MKEQITKAFSLYSENGAMGINSFINAVESLCTPIGEPNGYVDLSSEGLYTLFEYSKLSSDFRSNLTPVYFAPPIINTIDWDEVRKKYLTEVDSIYVPTAFIDFLKQHYSSPIVDVKPISESKVTDVIGNDTAINKYKFEVPKPISLTDAEVGKVANRLLIDIKLHSLPENPLYLLKQGIRKGLQLVGKAEKLFDNQTKE